MAKATLEKLNHKTKYIKLADYPTVKISQTLPFKVRFTSINIEGYSRTNVPPIPLQVIGYSNYIL
jgi:hypothetical protein